MIFSGLIYIVYGIFKAIIALLPSMTLLPTEWYEAWFFIAGKFANFLWIMPAADTVVDGIEILMYFAFAIFSIWFFTWIRSWL